MQGLFSDDSISELLLAASDGFLPQAGAPGRPFDVVICGCAGRTGSLVAQYFAEVVAPKHPGLRWALAGHSWDEVEAVRDELWEQCSCTDIPAFTVILQDQASVDRLVRQTHLILAATSRQPQSYAPVVDACVRLGTDYVGIVDEPKWADSLVQWYHTAALENHVLIVPVTFADLGALFAAQQVQEQFGQPMRRIRYSMRTCCPLDGALATSGSGLRALRIPAQPWAAKPAAGNSHFLHFCSDSRVQQQQSLSQRLWAEPCVEAHPQTLLQVIATAADGRELLCEAPLAEPDVAAQVLAESGLCFLLSRHKLRHQGGVLTPASAGGPLLLRRLLQTGFAFHRVQEIHTTTLLASVSRL